MGILITLIVGIGAVSTFILAQHKEEIWKDIRDRLE